MKLYEKLICLSKPISSDYFVSEHTLGRRQSILPQQSFHSPGQTGKGIGGTQGLMLPGRFLQLHIHRFWIFSLLSLQRIFQGLLQVCWWALRNKKKKSIYHFVNLWKKSEYTHTNFLRDYTKLCNSSWHTIRWLRHFLLQKYSFTIICRHI